MSMRSSAGRALLAALLVVISNPALAELVDQSGGDGGAFGEWATDEYGLPVYRFTLDQTVEQVVANYSSVVKDSAEVGETGQGPFHQDSTASIFSIGNDELVLLLSTYGHAQVRQDEGGPKLLNDFSPPDNQFGGGLGYLVDSDTGKLLLTTRYVGSKASPQQHYQREYGVGYARRTLSTELGSDGVTPAGLVMEHRLVVPFGSDPVVVSQTVLANKSPRPLSLSYYEVWGSAMYQMAYGQGAHTAAKQDGRRVFQGSNYTASVQRMQNFFGVSCQQSYIGRPRANTPPGSALGATLWDEHPPLTFLVNAYEHDVTTESGCSASAFFGSSDTNKPARPDFDLRCSTDDTVTDQSDAALILRRNVSLAVGETLEFAFLYGYVVPGSGASMESLIAKYSYGRTRGNEILVENGQLWRSNIPWMKVETLPWLGREVAWNYAMTRQALTFDSFFQENILDQGTGYRYDIGFQGAARDPLQHALPFIFTEPNIIKSIIRYTLKELHIPTSEPGDTLWNLPYFVVGHGIVGPPDTSAQIGARPSDEELYLLFAVTEYAMATHDLEFLSESVLAYNSTLNRTVLRCLVDCYKYVASNIGVGSHGILRMQTGDWNDVFVQEAMNSGSSRAEVIASAESSTNAAMAAAVLPRFAELIELSAKVTGDTQYLSLAKEVRDFAASQAEALHKHAWNGAWLNRAWIPVPKNGSNPGAQQFPGGWACTNGVDDRLCLEPQPWAILASSTRSQRSKSSVGEGPTAVLTRAQITTLVESLRTKLKSPLGSTVLSAPFARTAVWTDTEVSFRSTSENAADAGEHENGGVWPSQNHPLVLALATVNATAALDEWVRNSRSTQAQLFPQFWPGVWSAADVVTSHLSTDGQAGTQAWPAMPVLCTHPHSWPVYSAARLAGLSFDEGGLRLAPALPVAVGGYSLQTSLATVERIHHPDGVIEYAGRYTPLRTTTCLATVSLRAAHPEVLLVQTIAKVQVGIDDGMQPSENASVGSRELPSQLQAVDSEGELRFPRQVCGPGAALVFRIHFPFSSGNFEDV